MRPSRLLDAHRRGALGRATSWHTKRGSHPRHPAGGGSATNSSDGTPLGRSLSRGAESRTDLRSESVELIHLLQLRQRPRGCLSVLSTSTRSARAPLPSVGDMSSIAGRRRSEQPLHGRPATISLSPWRFSIERASRPVLVVARFDSRPTSTRHRPTSNERSTSRHPCWLDSRRWLLFRGRRGVRPSGILLRSTP